MLFAEGKENVAVVLTDMMMPFMDGAATIRALQKLKPNLKIIAASGLATSGHTATGDGPEVQAFLPKPYTAERLLTTIRDMIRNKT